MKRGANENRYVSSLSENYSALPTHHSDQLARQGLIKDNQYHVQRVLATGRLYGPMTPEAQLKAVEYAYGIKKLR